MFVNRLRNIDSVLDAFIVVLLASIAAFQVWDSSSANPRWADALAAAAAIAPLYWRRNHSRVVAFACASALVLQAAIWESTDLIAVIIAMLVAAYSVAAYNPVRAALPGALALATAASFSILTDQSDDAANIPPTLLLFVGLPFVAGMVLHRRHREFVALEADVDARASNAVNDERLRIARELHDVVAHNISVIAIQADAASAALKSAPDRAAEPLASIRRAASDALAEMQQMLMVLRDDDAAPAHSPPPGIDEIDALVRSVIASGVGVDLIRHGERRDVDAGVGQCAFRVVQEGLTNAIKHADGSRVSVVERFEAERLVISVEDSGGGSSPNTSSGVGLIGLRERIGLFGGTLEAGPQGDGWMLCASLPLAAVGAAH